jgi:hypothetical protein
MAPQPTKYCSEMLPVAGSCIRYGDLPPPRAAMRTWRDAQFRMGRTSRHLIRKSSTDEMRVYREQCANPEARERRIASNGGDVFRKKNILFEGSFQRTPLRMKNGRNSSWGFKDGSAFLRMIAPYQQVISSDASFWGSSRQVAVPLSI